MLTLKNIQIQTEKVSCYLRIGAVITLIIHLKN